MAAILAAVRPNRLGPLFEFLIATGCRLGEALGLRWQAVDRERGELEFVQTLGRVNGREIWSRPKTDAGQRTFPMTAGVRSALATQEAAQDAGLTGAPPQMLVEGGVRHGPLVFTAPDGGPLSASYVTHTLQRLLVDAGLPKLRMHDMRHLFVSSLFASSVPLELNLAARRPCEPQFNPNDLPSPFARIARLKRRPSLTTCGRARGRDSRRQPGASASCSVAGSAESPVSAVVQGD